MKRPLAVVLVCLGPLLVGCGDEPDDRTPSPPTVVRHDLAPLTTRFPALGEPSAASWVTWNSHHPDDRGVPGPTTYWIDAVVSLAPAVVNALVRDHQPVPEGEVPDVQDLLRPELPAGPYLTDARLDLAFTTPELATAAYLDPSAHVLVLRSTGM
ncbi:hypothetical protein [Mycolicibacterium arenosum]|uniref:Uncharacterized protein n=1 Tax=Mycolicibacterium arenosum TaxID=2952157 RepID=A0ABT1M3U2_9MYCO|nr:hypothetical protein [Mycolicibacterium sp. CAU 1645]MCP9273834.1 hypothetical protein [Mycolicibacterium sp. CAU 1645]